MLHWQAPKWLSKISLETRVLLCSTILHLVILIALFVVYQGTANYNITISGSMINPDAEIVFMPLHRSIKQQAKGSLGGATQTSSKSGVASSKTTQEPGTTIVKIAKPKPKPKLSKKESKKAEAKKALDATQPTPKATAGREKETQKKDQAAKNEKPEPKVEEKKSAEPATEKITDLKENANTNVNAASSTATSEAVDTNIVYVGQEEMDSLQAQEYIQQELAQHWAPPVGMRSDLFAVITITIDFEGVIKQVEITQTSGNLLFDTAAKKAAAQITPARWTFGKKMAITFKP